MKNIFLVLLVGLSITLHAQHEHHNMQQSDSIVENEHSMYQHHHGAHMEAPISVMGSHLHKKGGWMVSYRFMQMDMGELLKGKDDISNEQAHDEGYMVTPLEMRMDMHMIGAMYAPSDRLTLMLMLNYVSNAMDMQMRNMMSGMIMPFSTASSGFGDVKVSGLYSLHKSDNNSLHGELGISIPTGSIDETDETPMSGNQEVALPYAMQIGSGTFDTKLALTYVFNRTGFSWGHQLKGLLRFGENNRDYRMGNQIGLDNWIAVNVVDWLSLSGRLEGLWVDAISGANPELNPMMSTTTDTANYGGTFVNTGFGFNAYFLESMKLGAEISVPIYQDVNGIQLKQKETISLGLTYTF